MFKFIRLLINKLIRLFSKKKVMVHNPAYDPIILKNYIDNQDQFEYDSMIMARYMNKGSNLKSMAKDNNIF